jgi:hypothetical protein
MKNLQRRFAPIAPGRNHAKSPVELCEISMIKRIKENRHETTNASDIPNIFDWITAQQLRCRHGRLCATDTRSNGGTD